MKLIVQSDDVEFAIQLDSTSASQDLWQQLPLTLSLKDFAGAEKIAYLPRKLTTTGAPKGSGAKAGELCYYAPWGNLALFYKKAGYAAGLICLGRVVDDVNVAALPEGNVVIRAASTAADSK